MDLRKQKQILTWIIGSLVVINLVVIGLWIYETYSESDTENGNVTTETFRDDSRRKPGHPRMGMFDRFGFNEAQKGSIQTSMTRYHDKIVTYHDSIRNIRSRMMQELATESPDTTKIFSGIRAISKYHRRIYEQKMRHFMEMRKIATPEQRIQLNDFFRNIAQRRGFVPHKNQSPRHHGKHNRPRNRK